VNRTIATHAARRSLAGAFAVALVVAAPLALMAGCNTAEGIGEDVEQLGEGIEEEAED